MNKIIISISLLAIFSCNKEPQKKAEVPQQKPAQTTTKQEVLKLDTMAFPAEVQGCSCYFAANQEDFEKEKYLYVDDYGNNAYIKINGETIKFPLEEGDFDPEHLGKVIKNDKYTITINGEKLKDQEEVMMFQGTMTVEDHNGNRTETPIYGECGC